MTDSKETALLAAKTLDNKKAQDIVIIDIAEKASFADYFVLASGNSERQIGTLAEDIDDIFAKEGVPLKNIEGKKTSGWILLDYGNLIIHIFDREQRSFYSLERIWGDAKEC